MLLLDELTQSLDSVSASAEGGEDRLTLAGVSADVSVGESFLHQQTHSSRTEITSPPAAGELHSTGRQEILVFFVDVFYPAATGGQSTSDCSVHFH